MDNVLKNNSGEGQDMTFLRVIKKEEQPELFSFDESIPHHWNELFQETYRNFLDCSIYRQFVSDVKRFEKHKESGGLISKDIKTTRNLTEYLFRTQLSPLGLENLKCVGNAFYYFNGKFWEVISEEEKLHPMLFDINSKTYLKFSFSKKEKRFVFTKDYYYLNENYKEQRKNFLINLKGVFQQYNLCDDNFFNKDNLPIGFNALDGFARLQKDGTFKMEVRSPEQRMRKCFSFNVKPLLKKSSRLFEAGSFFYESLFGKVVERFTESCPKEKIKKISLLSEVFACAVSGISTKLAQPKAIFLHGQANSGKSVFIEVLRKFVGASQVSAVAPKMLSADYEKIKLKDKYLNICHDIGNEPLDGAEFKRIIAGEIITGREPYKPPQSFHSIALHVFAGNTLPGSIKGGTGVDSGVARRVMILPMDNPFTGQKNPFLPTEIVEKEEEILVLFALFGLQSLACNGWEFTELEESKIKTKNWGEDADDVRYFFHHLPQQKDSFTTTETLFKAFQEMQSSLNGNANKFSFKSFSVRIAECLKSSPLIKSEKKRVNGIPKNGYTGIKIDLKVIEDRFGKESFKTSIDWFSDPEPDHAEAEKESEREKNSSVDESNVDESNSLPEQDIFSRFATDCCVHEQSSDSAVQTGSSMVQFFERWQWWVYNKVPYMEKKNLSEQYNTLNAFQDMAIPYLEAQHKQGQNLQLKEM